MNDLQLISVDDDAGREACFPVMQLLRPHLTDKAAFVQQLQRQAVQGYRLLAASVSGQVLALAGYRLSENLLYGRFLYVDDLVAADAARSHGVGQRLIEALRIEAQAEACAHLVLDTALSNALAQRFYFRQGLLSRGLHFSQRLA